MKNVSDANIRRVGSYWFSVADPVDCLNCHNAEFGDFLYNGICGKCLHEKWQNSPRIENPISSAVEKPKEFYIIWYVKGGFGAILNLLREENDIGNIGSSLGYKDEPDDDNQITQEMGIFPEEDEGSVTIQFQGDGCDDDGIRRGKEQWRIVFSCATNGYEIRHPGYWLGPGVLEQLETFSKDYTKNLNGEAAEWGVRDAKI